MKVSSSSGKTRNKEEKEEGTPKALGVESSQGPLCFASPAIEKGNMEPTIKKRKQSKNEKMEIKQRQEKRERERTLWQMLPKRARESGERQRKECNGAQRLA